MKSLKDISWIVPEDTYRNDPALSYSILSRFEKGGFAALKNLYEKESSDALLFGSCVDAILTNGGFNEKFIVADADEPQPAVKELIEHLYNIYGETIRDYDQFSNEQILTTAEMVFFYPRFGDEKKLERANTGKDYYNFLCISENKEIVTKEMYEKVQNCVQKLIDSPCGFLFKPTTNENVETLYQLKFKATFDDIEYRVMPDILQVDHVNKVIYPWDLKTTSSPEYDFYKSFIKWNYSIQARLYWRVIKENLKNDDYFKDFRVEDYRFVVANRDNPVPLSWIFDKTNAYGTINYCDGKIKMKDPFDLGKQLMHYLTDCPPVPDGIDFAYDNDLSKWIENDR